MPIRVLLADDSDMVRRAIRNLLSEYSEIEIVAEAIDFAETVRIANEIRPQVVVLDLHMEDETSFSRADIKSQLNGWGSSIVAISIFTDADAQALAGTLGVTLLDKMNLVRDLVPAIRASAGLETTHSANPV
jgi:DNA-binding NarL/FixJ family response regulator